MKEHYKMNLNLFAIDVPETVKELSEEERKITYTPLERISAAIQAAYLQHIEENTSEIRVHMEEDDFIRMLNAAPYNSGLLESIDKTLKSLDKRQESIDKTLKLIAGRV